MSDIESKIIEKFPEIEFVAVIDLAKDNPLSELKDQTAAYAWMNWLNQTKSKFNNLTIQLDNNRSLIIRSINDNSFLIIGNKDENNLLLSQFVDNLKAEVPSDFKIENNTKSIEATPASIQSDLKMMDAVRIQKLILPKQEDLKKEFKSFFVVHEQQDVVGGDFYWYSRKGNNVLLAIVDCTGHSVEGAMTSMVCNSLLNQAFSDFDGTHVCQLLRDFYVQLLKYNKTSSDVTNYGIGAEVGLFHFNHEKEVITFCSTGISAVIRRENGLEHIKAKKIISYDNLEHSLTQTTFSMRDVTGIYGFTDGLSDQFDAKDKKKLGTRGILKMIAEEENFDAEYYLSEINKWKGNNMQYDDITLIGLAI